MKIIKWFALIVGGLLAVVVVAALVVPNVIDWNGYKPRIAAAVRDATGRDLKIGGDLKISMWPNLDFSVSAVSLSNAPGLSPPEMLSIASVVGKVELWPLLSGQLVIDNIAVKNAVIHLAVDKAGQPNWVLGPKTAAAGQPAGVSALTVKLGDFKLEGSELSYADATTGQQLDAKNISLTTAMSDLARPFSVNGQMTINSEPLTVELAVDSPRRLLDGQKASAKLKVASKRANASFDGSARQRPTPGLDGVFALDVPSVGQLAAWLGRPLEKSQPDPGSLKIQAEFATDGPKAVLKSATVTGTAMKMTASGSLDDSGPAPKLVLQLDSAMLDIDRYLPPAPRKEAAAAAGTAAPQPAPATGAAALPAPIAAPAAGAPHLANPFAALSDKAIDLSALKAMDVDVKLTVAGVKALGYEIGRVAFTATAKGGLLNADLTELALYGGTVKGTAKLNAAGKTLDLDTALKIDHVTVDKLAAAAGSVPASGIVSATLEAKATGASPRALAESLHGKLALDLGGMSLKSATAHGISGVKLELDMPAADKPFSLKGNLVYNGEQIDLDATLDAPNKMFSADKFTAKLALASKIVTLGYNGTVQQRPMLGLDGTFDLDVPSVGKLAAWAGQPLDAKEPDPGPLKAHAVLTADGAKFTLKEGTIAGKALKATASASLDGASKPASFDAKIELQQADLNAYLPAPAPKATSSPSKARPTPAGAPTGWSTAPLDLTALHLVNGQAQIKLAGVRYRDLDINQGQIKASLQGGVLKINAEKVALAQGTITSDVTLDGSAPAAKFDYQVSVTGVQALPLLKTFADSERLSGTIAFQANGKASGRSERELTETLNGAGQFKITDGAIHGVNIASALRKVGTLGIGGGPEEKTDFAELSGTFTIKNGILENRDMKMLAPIVRLTGTGTVPIPPETVDYAVEAKLVASLQGQGGADALAGLPIPIKITGPWSNPSYNVDWNAALADLAKDPARLKNLPANLQGLAKGLGTAGSGLGGGLLNAIPGLPGQTAPASASSTTSTTSTAPSAPSAQQPATTTLPKALKGLFGQ